VRVDGVLMFLGHVLWAGVTIYAIHMAAKVVTLFAPVRTDALATSQEVVVPDDLVAYAMSQSEQWAQEDAMRAIQQSYDQWKDWNRVRAAIGIGRID
jgi:hypothetical protein